MLFSTLALEIFSQDRKRNKNKFKEINALTTRIRFAIDFGITFSRKKTPNTTSELLKLQKQKNQKLRKFGKICHNIKDWKNIMILPD